MDEFCELVVVVETFVVEVLLIERATKPAAAMITITTMTTTIPTALLIALRILGRRVENISRRPPWRKL
jgi:hypothetical protein